MRTARHAIPSGKVLLLSVIAGIACESAPASAPSPGTAKSDAAAAPASLPLDTLAGNRAFDDLEELAARSADPAALHRFVAERLGPTGMRVETVTTPSVGPEGSAPVQHVVAQLPGASSDLFLLVAPLGPGGVQDDYSGAALLLEVARVMSTRSLPYGTRFVWIGGAQPDGATSYAKDLASRGEAARVRLLVAFEHVCDEDLRVARDLGSQRVHREEFFDAATRTGHEDVFPRDAGFETIQAVHLAFRDAGVRGVVALAPAARPDAATAPRSCSARTLAAVGDVTLAGVDAIGRRLAKIDRFSRAPIATLEESPVGAPPSAPAPAATPTAPSSAGTPKP